jgi:hypothetical protein
MCTTCHERHRVRNGCHVHYCLDILHQRPTRCRRITVPHIMPFRLLKAFPMSMTQDTPIFFSTPGFSFAFLLSPTFPIPFFFFMLQSSQAKHKNIFKVLRCLSSLLPYQILATDQSGLQFLSALQTEIGTMQNSQTAGLCIAPSLLCSKY